MPTHLAFQSLASLATMTAGELADVFALARARAAVAGARAAADRSVAVIAFRSLLRGEAAVSEAK